MAYTLKPIGDEWFETAPLVVPAVRRARRARRARVGGARLRRDVVVGADHRPGGVDRPRGRTPRGRSAACGCSGLNTIEEEFYRWEVNRRATFRVTQQTRPLFDGLAEDFLLEPLRRRPAPA